jgi:S1-C subfamily serine protease
VNPHYPNPEPPRVTPEGSPFAEPNPLSAPHLAFAPSPPRHSRLLWVGLSVLAGFFLLASGILVGVAVEQIQLHGGTRSSIAGQAPNPVSGIQIPGITGGSAPAGSVQNAIVDINTVLQGVSQNGQAAGTGMIVSSDGLILTNNHVIAGASQISVSIPNHSTAYTATVVGADPAADVALIRVSGVSGLPTVKFASSSSLSVGEHVTAIGNAFGRGGSPSVTDGSITALGQSITASDGPGSNSEQLTDMIQTDASISPGDSGGALVDDSGQVVGMITAGQATGYRRQTSTVGFAIPASDALNVINQIRSGAASSDIVYGNPAYLGVQVTDLDAGTAARLGLSVTVGALVMGVVADSPAASIGLARNSVIVAVGSRQVTSAADLGPALHAYKPGQKAKITWVDASGAHTATATLVAGPAA